MNAKRRIGEWIIKVISAKEPMYLNGDTMTIAPGKIAGSLNDPR